MSYLDGKCACLNFNASECARARYSYRDDVLSGLDDDEPCECACHDGEPTDEDGWPEDEPRSDYEDGGDQPVDDGGPGCLQTAIDIGRCIGRIEAMAKACQEARTERRKRDLLRKWRREHPDGTRICDMDRLVWRMTLASWAGPVAHIRDGSRQPIAGPRGELP